MSRDNDRTLCGTSHKALNDGNGVRKRLTGLWLEVLPGQVFWLSIFKRDRGHHPRQLWRKPTNAIALDDEVCGGKFPVFNELQHLGIHLGPLRLNKVEDERGAALLTVVHEPMTKFGRSPYEASALYTLIRAAARMYGQKPVADATGLARGSIAKICEGASVHTRIAHAAIRSGIDALTASKRTRLRAAVSYRNVSGMSSDRSPGPSAPTLSIAPSLPLLRYPANLPANERE